MAVLFHALQAKLPGAAIAPAGANCTQPRPHSFNCVHQPDFVLQSSNILAFENFFYVASALGVQPLGSGSSSSIASNDSTSSSSQVAVFPLQTTPLRLYESSKHFCSLDWSTIQQHYPRDAQPKDVNLKACFLGAYAYSFLVDGLKLPVHKPITIQKEVQGSEIEWALGAAYKEAAGFLKRSNLRPT
jgi:hypothetical protein